MRYEQSKENQTCDTMKVSMWLHLVKLTVQKAVLTAIASVIAWMLASLVAVAIFQLTLKGLLYQQVNKHTH